MQNSKKKLKFQIHRQQKPINFQNLLYQEPNNKQLYQLFENKNNHEMISKEIINQNKSKIANNKSLQLLNLILQHQSKRELIRTNHNQPAVSKSLIIRKSLPTVKPINQPIISCREKKSCSVQQQRKQSSSYNQNLISMRETIIGPWEE
ncbi:unnamed protein product [Paramecium sonneborni]|uniref:Uncharacterized protein n=1 Tax=Paramecium sonneborni TaxID=65129 RepID=A0A8S1MP02_9CILI|nr:unnamed protein product [Paramecium sonneborni]